MYKKFITPVYVLNIIFQSVFDLLTPAGIAFLAAWLLDKYTEVGGWIYAALITPGILIGFFSMISFILRATAALAALEKQNKEKYGKADRKRIEENVKEEKNEQ